MRRQRVKSAGVRSIGYSRRARVLEIEFAGGRVYDYFNVPARCFEELDAAASKGIYVNTIIKPRFRCREVRHEDDQSR